MKREPTTKHNNHQTKETLQGKDPLMEVFVGAPIKIAQKFVYRR